MTNTDIERDITEKTREQYVNSRELRNAEQNFEKVIQEIQMQREYYEKKISIYLRQKETAPESKVWEVNKMKEEAQG